VFGAPGKVACFVATPVPEGRTEVVHGWGWHNEWPSWTWPGEEGKPLTVRVYSSCPQVRLLLNGRDLGTQPTSRETRFAACFEVPYEAGSLVAIGLDEQGDETARDVLTTAGPAAAVRLVPDRTTLCADGQDLSFITVELVDGSGALDPNACDLVEFEVSGPGSIAAVANSDPKSIESFQQPRRTAWRGRCLLILRAGEDAGEVRVTARVAGLASAELSITVGG